MMQNQADAGFMRHVLTHPATAAQRAKAEEKLAKHEHEAARLAAQVGDSDEVADRHVDLPPDRRTWHLSGLMTFRHRLLRELNEPRQRQRLRTILAMPAPDAADMCSECEAPALWHTWDVSLCLYRGKPSPNRTMPPVNTHTDGASASTPSASATSAVPADTRRPTDRRDRMRPVAALATTEAAVPNSSKIPSAPTGW
jgi:hypothetical protein